LFKEDEACPDGRGVFGEGEERGTRAEGSTPGAAVPGEQCGTRAEGSTPGAACGRGDRPQPCRFYPNLPEAIAPSLASTPTFARHNTSWCHAIEVSVVSDPKFIQSFLGFLRFLGGTDGTDKWCTWRTLTGTIINNFILKIGKEMFGNVKKILMRPVVISDLGKCSFCWHTLFHFVFMPNCVSGSLGGRGGRASARGRGVH
jgi:hypothetical protein